MNYRRPDDFYEVDMTTEITIGSAFPLGATLSSDGVNFAVYSKSATKVDLLFFDSVDAAGPSRVISLDAHGHRTYHYWHISVPQVQPGQIYGYHAYGPFEPDRGLRFDPQKVLLDPYGRGVAVPRVYDRTVASRAGRQCGEGDEERGRGFERLRLGRRPASAAPLCRYGDLRNARGRLHATS